MGTRPSQIDMLTDKRKAFASADACLDAVRASGGKTLPALDATYYMGLCAIRVGQDDWHGAWLWARLAASTHDACRPMLDCLDGMGHGVRWNEETRQYDWPEHR